MKKILSILIASLTGLAVLAGYYFQEKLAPVLSLLMNWGILLIGTSLLIGVGYLVRMHVLRVQIRQKRSVYSIIVLIAFIVTLIAGLLLGTQSDAYRDWVLNIQIPVETSLLAIFAVILLSSGLYLVRTRGWTPMSIGFLLGALIALTFYLNIMRISPESEAWQWLSFIRRLPLAGLRGILIGMALGGLIVGLRVLLTIDRPFDGK